MQKVIFSLDVESIGLYGAPFAFGASVRDTETDKEIDKEIDSFFASCSPYAADLDVDKSSTMSGWRRTSAPLCPLQPIQPRAPFAMRCGPTTGRGPIGPGYIHSTHTTEMSDAWVDDLLAVHVAPLRAALAATRKEGRGLRSYDLTDAEYTAQLKAGLGAWWNSVRVLIATWSLRFMTLYKGDNSGPLVDELCRVPRGDRLLGVYARARILADEEIARRGVRAVHLDWKWGAFSLIVEFNSVQPVRMSEDAILHFAEEIRSAGPTATGTFVDSKGSVIWEEADLARLAELTGRSGLRFVEYGGRDTWIAWDPPGGTLILPPPEEWDVDYEDDIEEIPDAY